MGQYTIITITAAPKLDIEQLLALADGHLHDADARTDEHGIHRLSGHSKWTPEDFIASVVDLTENLPDATVTVDEEWDTRDADEPGQVITRYRGGVKLSQATQVSALVPEDLTTSIASVRAALAGEGDVASSVTWLLDGLKGERN